MITRFYSYHRYELPSCLLFTVTTYPSTFDHIPVMVPTDRIRVNLIKTHAVVHRHPSGTASAASLSGVLLEFYGI